MGTTMRFSTEALRSYLGRRISGIEGSVRKFQYGVYWAQVKDDPVDVRVEFGRWNFFTNLLVRMSQGSVPKGKAALLADLEQRWEALRGEENFDPRNGYAQVRNKSPLVATRYGEWRAIEQLRTSILEVRMDE